MPEKISNEGLTLPYILSDASPHTVETLKAVRDALIEVIGPSEGEFSDPQYIEETILPVLYQEYVSWQAFADETKDDEVSVSRFCGNLKRYAYRMKRQRTFKRAPVSQALLEVTWDQHLRHFGSRYSSIPAPKKEDDEGVSFKAPPRLDTDSLTLVLSNQVIEIAEELMPSFVSLAGSGLGCIASRDYVARMMDAFEAFRGDKIRNLAPFLQFLFQNETKVHLRAFMYRFEDWFFGGFIEDMGRLQEEGGRLLDEGNLDGIKRIKDGFQEQYDKGTGYLDSIKKVREAIRSVLEETDAGGPYRSDWRGYIRRAQGLGHDYGNVLSVVLLRPIVDMMMIESVKDEKTIDELREMMKPFDVSSTSNIINMVIRMLKTRADESGVSLEKRLAEDVALPYEYRAAYFRISHELLNNPIKYHDGDKKHRYVRVVSERTEENFITTFTDNGVGIGDIEEAMKWYYRERPDLAPGSGVGLANVVKLAEENGWKVEIKSKLGVGTEVKLLMGIVRGGSLPSGGAMGIGESGDGFDDAVLASGAAAAGVASAVSSTYSLASSGAFLVAALA